MQLVVWARGHCLHVHGACTLLYLSRSSVKWCMLLATGPAAAPSASCGRIVQYTPYSCGHCHGWPSCRRRELYASPSYAAASLPQPRPALHP
jgi:hypothetical protein